MPIRIGLPTGERIEVAVLGVKGYQVLLKQHGMICSMSRKGNCCYYAPIERFFSSLKREWNGDRLYKTRQAAIADVRKYVAVYYNSKRLHSTRGYKTPMDYEKDLNKKCTESVDHYTIHRYSLDH